MASTGSTKNSGNKVGGEVKKGEQAARHAAYSPLVEDITRIGYVVRGVIYGLIGLVAFEVAMGGRSSNTNQQGAIATIGRQPFGHYLLIVVAIGLAGYALWGFIRAILDPLHKGTDAKGIITRLGYLFSGVSYAALLLPTISYIQGGKSLLPGTGGSGNTAQTVATLLSKPWGKWVVILIGLLGIAGGLYQFYLGVKAKFDQRFKSYALSPDQKRFATQLGRFGTAARGLVFALVGFFLVQAALHLNPNEARGIDGALQSLATQPNGQILLGVIAIGLIAFGLYSIMGGFWFKLRR